MQYVGHPPVFYAKVAGLCFVVRARASHEDASQGRQQSMTSALRARFAMLRLAAMMDGEQDDAGTTIILHSDLI